MRLAVLFILTIMVGLVLGPLIQQIPGSLVLVFTESTVQMRLWQVVVMVAAAALLFIFSYHLVVRFWQTAGWLRNWTGSRRDRRARRKTLQGLVALHEGHWAKAENLLSTSGQDTDTALINFLAAADAAQRQGEIERRDNYLQLAVTATPGAAVAIGLVQARYQTQSKQTEAALATLNHVLQLAPKQPLAQQRLLMLYQQVGEWQQAIKLLPELKNNKSLTEMQKNELQTSLWSQSLQVAAEQGGIEALHSTWLALPKTGRQNGTIEFLYLKLLVENNATLEADKLIRKCLSKQPSDRYLLLYGKLQSDDPAKQLAFVEKMAAHYENNFAWYLTAGRLCLRQELWGKAKAYLQQCREIKESQEVLGLLGLAYEAVGETDAAYACFKKAYTKHIN